MSSRGRWVLLALLLIAGALRIAAASLSSPVDDAFITYRYAQNLAAGHGFVYNPGERVLGTTTPLFTLLLTPFVRLGFRPEIVASAIAVLAALGTMLVLFRLVSRVMRTLLPESPGREEGPGLLAAAFYGFFYAGIASSGYGMEAPLFELLALWSLERAVSGKTGWSGLAGGLAALTRPEGFILAGILGAAAMIRSIAKRTPLPWIALSTFAAVVVPWVVFATLYFGSFIPNSVMAKASQQEISFRDWAYFFLLRNPVISLTWVGAAVGASWAALRRSSPLGLLVVWAGSYVLFFLIERPPFLGLWYFPPLAAPLLALSAAGVALSLSRLRRIPLRLGLTAAGLVWIGLFLLVAPRAIRTAEASRAAADRVYRPMAEWVREQTGPDDVVEICDIGYVGYWSQRTILDAGALVSPEVWRHYAQRAGDPNKDVHFALERKPAALIIPAPVYQRYIEGGVLQLYRPVIRFRPEGPTDPPSVAGAPEAPPAGGRFVPDYIAFLRIDAESSGSTGGSNRR